MNKVMKSQQGVQGHGFLSLKNIYVDLRNFLGSSLQDNGEEDFEDLTMQQRVRVDFFESQRVQAFI